MGSEKISNKAVFHAILITLGAGLIFAMLNYAPNPPDIFPLFSERSPWLVILLYLICHPIIGKIFSVIVEVLCNANDHIYKFEEDSTWGGWEKETKLYFAALWPISAPVGLTITLLALIYGLLMKGLFR